MTRRGFVLGDRILGQSADSHADWCAAYGQLGMYRFVGASAIGKLHLRDVRPRDDAFAVRSSGVWLAVAVADGAGSRKQSRYGASFAVEALCEHLLREAKGSSPLFEAAAAVSSPQTDERDKPTRMESVAQPTQQTDTAGGLRNLWSRLLGRAPAQAAANGEAVHPLPAFDALSSVAPSDETATACGTLTWHWHAPVPGMESAPPQPQSAEVVTAPLDMGECVRRAFQHTRAGLEQFAQSRIIELRELHCTLLGLLLNTETGAVAAGHIGDGLVAALHPGLGAQPLVEAPTPGEVGETYVLTQNDWQKYLAVRPWSPQEAEGMTTFYLMTDGVADDCTHPPPADIFPRWARDIDREMRKEEPLPQTATRLLRWLAAYEARGSWDDRTLAVVLRNTGA